MEEIRVKNRVHSTRDIYMSNRVCESSAFPKLRTRKGWVRVDFQRKYWLFKSF
jgi:hypothetical protein